MKPTADPWQPRARDMPRGKANKLEGRQFRDLRENPVFRWLIQAQRRRRLPPADDLNPLLLGLLVPLFPLLLIFVLARMIGRLTISDRARRGLLMHLPEPLLRDLVQTRLVLGDIVAAVWGFEAGAGKFQTEGRWLKAALGAMLLLSLTELSFLVCPLVALLAGRMMLRRAYPYDCFPKLVRILRRQAAEVQGRTRASSYMEIYMETILAAGLRGCGFLILLFIWEGLVLIMFHSTGLVYLYDFPARVDFLIVGLAAAAFGMVIGAMIAADLESEHKRYLQDIYRYADEIVQHWWHARPFDGAKKERNGGAS